MRLQSFVFLFFFTVRQMDIAATKDWLADLHHVLLSIKLQSQVNKKNPTLLNARNFTFVESHA